MPCSNQVVLYLLLPVNAPIRVPFTVVLCVCPYLCSHSRVLMAGCSEWEESTVQCTCLISSPARLSRHTKVK